MLIKRFLYALVKRDIGSAILSWMMARIPGRLPLDVLYESQSTLAFHHPRPSYPLHILIMPKKRYRTLWEIPQTDQDLVWELWSAVGNCVRQYQLEDSSYRVILNGGRSQEVPYLHVHLIGGYDE